MVKDIKNCGVIYKALGVLLLVFVIILISYYSAATKEKIKQIEYIGKGNESNVITVSKKGTVYATPNLVKVSFSVITEKKNVGDALKDNSDKSTAVIEFLKNQGIEENDIKTTYFNIYPLYEWRKTDNDIDYSSSGTRVLVGYEANQTIEVKIRDVQKVSDIIEGAVDAGANEVSNLSFIVENEESFKAQARTKAIIEAKAEAAQTAQTLGVKLGDIVGFTESAYYPYDSVKQLSSAEAYGAGSSSISAGENKIEVTVNIVFEIK
jgi:uncharacterized protein YggE